MKVREIGELAINRESCWHSMRAFYKDLPHDSDTPGVCKGISFDWHYPTLHNVKVINSTSCLLCAELKSMQGGLQGAGMKPLKDYSTKMLEWILKQVIIWSKSLSRLLRWPEDQAVMLTSEGLEVFSTWQKLGCPIVWSLAELEAWAEKLRWVSELCMCSCEQMKSVLFA